MLPEQSSSPYCTQLEVAAYLNTTDRDVRRLIASGQLPAYRLGKRRIRIKWADVEALLKPIPTAS